MILYVNGDSHTAAAEAVNPHAFAEDDRNLQYLGRLPHPDNLSVSWGRILADNIKAVFHCDAESAASNDRIMRTTQSWLESNKKEWYRSLIIIQWSTWEREEWLHQETYYQVNGSGIDQVPTDLQDQYKQYVLNIDWQQKTLQAHEKIWQLHHYLQQNKIPHLFFNGDNHFGSIVNTQRKDWGINYLSPYDPTQTYSAVLRANGHETVAPGSYHYGQNAHRYWASYLLRQLALKRLL